jgi:hypothetical protein
MLLAFRWGSSVRPQVVRGSEPVDLGTRKQRALLAALAMHGGRPVSVDAIIDLLWGDDPPGAVTATLQAYVAGAGAAGWARWGWWLWSCRQARSANWP